MKRVRNHRLVRPVAALTAGCCLFVWSAPPAVAFRTPHRRKPGHSRPAGPAGAAPAPSGRRELSEAEMRALRGRGPYRNPYFCGVLPWQRSLRDVNLCNGNLFKSFTDIQVPPARGAGLAWQRTYNSNDGRVGPFGIGWTHAYDIRIEEADPGDVDNSGQTVGPDKVARTDFFGGKHTYRRDADGLYSPPPYLFDELSSEYLNFLADGPQEVLSDEQRGMDGTVKHFISGGTDPDGSPSAERVCDYIEDRHGNRTTLEYGLEVPLPGGGTKKLLTRVTDPSGRSLEVGWQNLGTAQAPVWRIVQVRGPFDPTTGAPLYTVQYEYNTEFNLWRVRQDPGGLDRVTTYGYTSYTGPEGAETGLLASITDPLGHTVSYQYALGTDTTNTLWVSQIREPSSGAEHVWNLSAVVAFDPYGGMRLTASATSNGGLGVMVHADGRLRATGMSQANYYPTAIWSWQYDAANNVSDLWLSALAGEPGRLRQNFSTHRRMTYGPHGNLLTEQVEGNPAPTTYSYYPASKYFQKESITDPNGNVTRFDYYDKFDPNAGNRGEVKWVRDARYGVTGRQFEYAYNSYGQKIRETNLNHVVTEYRYEDAWGNLTRVVQDPGGLARTTTIEYDAAGRVVRSTDPKGQTSAFTYNSLGQPLQASLPGETVTYEYGANGRTEAVTDGRGRTTITYEPGNDRVASVTDPVTGTVSYTYGLAGERRSITLPGGGTWNYEYNAASFSQAYEVLPKDDPNSVTLMLTAVVDDQGRRAEYYQDQLGHLIEARTNPRYDGAGALLAYQQTRYTLDRNAAGASNGWLARIENYYWQKDPFGNWQSRLLVQNDYTYDAAGNRLTNTLTSPDLTQRTEQYAYDELHRLTGVNYGDGQTQSYSFDPMGNRLTKTDSLTGTETYTYNAANMLLSRNGQPYTNDANGNTLTGGGRTMTWDGQNRLVSCVYNGVTTTHTYGSDGLRRRTVQGSVTTDYVLDGQSVVRTLRNGVVDRTWLHGPRGPEYERDASGNVVWYLYDGLGSVLGTVDPAGNLVSTRKYDVYGAVRGSTGPAGPKHRFVGGLGHPSEEETGLIYMRARYYDAVTGRFISEDPARDGANWYLYASSNPVNRVDPDGREGVDAMLALIGGLLVSAGLAVIGITGRWGYLQGKEAYTRAVAELKKIEDRVGTVSRAQWLREMTNQLKNQSGLKASLFGAFVGYMLLQYGVSLLVEADLISPGRQEWPSASGP